MMIDQKFGDLRVDGAFVLAFVFDDLLNDLVRLQKRPEPCRPPSTSLLNRFDPSPRRAAPARGLRPQLIRAPDEIAVHSTPLLRSSWRCERVNWLGQPCRSPSGRGRYEFDSELAARLC